MDNAEIIKEAFENNNIQLTSSQLDKFVKYYGLLIEYNEKYNLTAITEIHEVANKHFVDSLLGEKLLAQKSSALDIGCGAGFPSIPLAIMRQDINFTLIDSVGKKINFVQAVQKALGLGNIEAIHTRAQEFCNAKNREKFDYAISRAVAPSNILLELSIPFLKQNGTMIAYKGINYQNELEQSKNALTQLKAFNSGILEKSLIIKTPKLNETQKRFILQFKKFGTTPSKFPRQKNLIKTNPL